jgi:hypothetical protein
MQLIGLAVAEHHTYLVLSPDPADPACDLARSIQPPGLSHPAARAVAAISRADLLDRPPKGRLWRPARNLPPDSPGIGARHPALVSTAG